MPEGPSIVLLKEELAPFRGKKINGVSGNAKIDLARLQNKKLNDIQSWGKHLLLCFDDFFLRIHMLMWGTWRINEKKDSAPRLSLSFKNGEVNFYTCSVKLVEGNTNDVYDWETDIMSDEWKPRRAKRSLLQLKKAKVCDVLLNQEIFSGVGNIIKNEVLFRIKVHPESLVEFLPERKLSALVRETRVYSLQFYEWKKIFELKKHWLIYKKKICPRCNIRTKTAWLGKNERLTCYCTNCQKLYTKSTIRKKSAELKK